MIIAVSHHVCKKEFQVTLPPEFLPSGPDLWTSIQLKGKLASATKPQYRGSMVHFISNVVL